MLPFYQASPLRCLPLRGSSPSQGSDKCVRNSEKKIDHFETRLAGIEQMLRDLTTSINRQTPSTSTPGTNESGPDPHLFRASYSSVSGDVPSGSGFCDDEVNDQADSEFEGHSSMAAQTVFASEFLEQAVAKTSLRELNPTMESALASLQQIVSMQNRTSAHESRFLHAKPLPRGGIRELPMPPMHLVIALLREIKEKPPITFTLICGFIAIENFTARCQKVYFATEDYSLATFGIVNALLYFLIQEKAEEPSMAELRKYHTLCRDNLETALANMPLLMAPRKENVETLLSGVTYAVEISKLTLAWQLNTAASIMCQTLGYHRQPVGQPIDETKASLFWFVYMFDKALSLRFGRASTIQDYDISIPRAFGVGVRVPDEAWKVVLNQWILHAECMGKVYEQLYSPMALTKPVEHRAEAARQIILRVDELARDREILVLHMRGKGLISGDMRNPYSMDMCFMSDEVMHYASLSLIYRALPAPPGVPGTFNTECITSARKAFKKHHECMQLISKNTGMTAGYIHWTLFYVPFVPIIVIFCHIIETCDMEDLRRLGEFVDSLQPICNISEAVDRFYRVGQVLNNVARLYVEAKAQQQQDQDMIHLNDGINTYLSQLGFFPDTPFINNTNDGDGDTGMDINQASQLGNWFSGNRHILGLVEEDPSEFEPRVWAAMVGP
ncbi:hypothetical protein B0H63DRAFT_401547 [Podospora didyma]|uniref:Xylanolytic transcriptional activator regulatory domain-containing protein n=1 Tax=Podospora didyma TaxID=330526 RepID=A0AAE0K9P5_9PEZI|nr:hypothetical protein B0H63DRAFT_401547 [Podospora didyma]